MEETTMRSWFRYGAMIVTVLAGATLAYAQDATSTCPRENGPPAAAADDDSTGSISTVGVGNRASLPLSDEQRSWIFLGVMNLPDVPDANVPTPGARATVPESVELQPLPEI